MAIGAVLLLAVGIPLQGLPVLSAQAWGIVLWLAVVNTALAFTLWNHTLRTLTATASSAVNNTMVIQIAVLAWVFLGQSLGAGQVAGLVVVAAGVSLVGRGTRAVERPRARR